MKPYATFLIVAACLASPCAKGAANTATPSSVGMHKNADTTLALKAPPGTSAAGSKPRSHRFPVTDEKGLLVTCIAPEIDKNVDTDIFNDCALAPGRTLDDVMHAFVSAIHYEQNRHAKEQSEGQKDPEKKPAENAAQK